MRPQESSLAHVGLVALLVCSLIATSLAQKGSATHEPTKFDEYGDLPSDDEAAHLDLFADRLFNRPKLRGYIRTYSRSQMQRGSYLRRLHGIARYLTEARGIEANRIAVVDGGYREKFVTQLWLVPEGAEPPRPEPSTSQPAVNTSSAYQFDVECLNCSAAVNLDLYGLDEGLKFYAQELRKNPDSRGLFLVRSDRNVSVREALKEARRAKRLLTKTHDIDAGRISIRSGRSRNDGTAVVEMWIVPRGAK